MPRSWNKLFRARRLRLLVTAVAVLLIGYYLGQQYRLSQLEASGARLLDDPVVVGTPPLPKALAQAMQGGWTLLLAGEPDARCEQLLRHYIQVFNRLAAWPKLQNRLRLVLLSSWSPAEQSPWRYVDWAKVYVLPPSQRAALLSLLGMPSPTAGHCTGEEATAALLGPDRRLYARVPLDKPTRMAESLRLILQTLDTMNEREAPGLGDRLNTTLLRVLPQHLLSAGMYRLARSETPWLKNALIRYVVQHYDVDMSEAVIEDPFAYPSFNAFFTRALKPEARPIDPEGLVSPVDAKVSQAGKIHHDRLLQAKGHEYSLFALLAGDGELASQFESGSFATLYLAPRDYHRIHMPLAGTLRTMVFVPGDLFSVSEATAQLVPGLFARNERVICLFDTKRGPMAVVLVGAIFVGSMETVWHGEVRGEEDKPRYWHYEGADAPHFAKGDEFARFNMGSTVIVLNTQHAVDLLEDLPGRRVRVGQKIGY